VDPVIELLREHAAVFRVSGPKASRDSSGVRYYITMQPR